MNLTRVSHTNDIAFDKITGSTFFYQFLHPRTKEGIFKLGDISYFKSDNFLATNYYSIIWILDGECNLFSEFSKYDANPGMMFFFSPYQLFQPRFEKNTEAIVMQFHSDFYCVEKHQKEIACNGTLFNNLLPPPYINAPGDEFGNFADIVVRIIHEIESHETAAHDAVLSYLKLFLIHAVRIKKDQFYVNQNDPSPDFPENLRILLGLIEKYYSTKHSPQDYADMLNISTKTLSRMTKTFFDKSPSEVITDKIIIEAKRELYLTDKTVRQIANELGFADEYYFSRMFKKKTSVSPTFYRKKTALNKVWIIHH